MKPIEERFKEAAKENPERCLWAWRYAEHGHGFLGKEIRVKGGIPPPVPTYFGIAGWTFCGRHTVRVLTVNEAKAVEALAWTDLPGLSWHLYENEPADALPASDELEQIVAARTEDSAEPDGYFTMDRVAMYGRAKPATCGYCRVNADLAMERGHIKEKTRLGEAIMLLHRNDGAVPLAAWWDPKTKLYRP